MRQIQIALILLSKGKDLWHALAAAALESKQFEATQLRRSIHLASISLRRDMQLQPSQGTRAARLEGLVLHEFCLALRPWQRRRPHSQLCLCDASAAAREDTRAHVDAHACTNSAPPTPAPLAPQSTLVPLRTMAMVLTPVPMPATSTSISPPVCAQISGPVER